MGTETDVTLYVRCDSYGAADGKRCERRYELLRTLTTVDSGDVARLKRDARAAGWTIVGGIEAQTASYCPRHVSQAPKDLDSIEARAMMATVGPWLPMLGAGGFSGIEHVISAHHRDERGHGTSVENEVFIAAARTDVPYLIERVRKAEAALAKLKGAASDEQ